MKNVVLKKHCILIVIVIRIILLFIIIFLIILAIQRINCNDLLISMEINYFLIILLEFDLQV